MIDTTFLEYLLIFIIIICSIYYFLQNNKNNNDDKNNLNAINNNINDISSSNSNSIINEKFLPIMPSKRQLGPVHNFHEKFNERLNTKKYKELGWRNWWFTNKRCSTLGSDTGFEGTVVKNYLSNMDNVKNMFL